MQDKIFVLLSIDADISDFRLFNDYSVALKNYLKQCIIETRHLLDQSDEDDFSLSISDSESLLSSHINEPVQTYVLQIYELNNKTQEYDAVNDYSIDNFQEFVNEKEDVEDFLDSLEKVIDNNLDLPVDVLDYFPVN